MDKIKKHFESIKEYHRNRAKLPYEEKVEQVIELQKIDIEFSKLRKEEIPSFKQVWELKKT